MLKKRKIDLEERIFNNRWNEEYFFIEKGTKALYLICKDAVSIFKEFNLKRHYDSKLKSTFGVYKGELRKEKFCALEKDFKKQQNVF